MESKIIVSAIAVFLFSAVAVDALRCYQCSGTGSGACFDPEGENVTSVVCEDAGAGDYVCFKLIYTNSNNDEAVFRGCQREANFDAYCNAVTGYDDVECLSCDEDLCNSSNKIGVISFTVLAFCLLLAKLI